MSESLRNDGRIWVPARIEDVAAIRSGELKPTAIPEENRDYYLERRYPAFGNLVPRDVASRAAKERCDEGYGVNGTGEGDAVVRALEGHVQAGEEVKPAGKH